MRCVFIFVRHVDIFALALTSLFLAVYRTTVSRMQTKVKALSFLLKWLMEYLPRQKCT